MLRKISGGSRAYIVLGSDGTGSNLRLTGESLNGLRDVARGFLFVDLLAS